MKNTGLLIRVAIILVVTLVGLYMVFGPRGSVSGSDFTIEGIKNNLAKNISLGLDLKGGSHLVMRVKVEEYLKTLTENNREAALKAAKDAQLPATEATSVTEKSKYSFTVKVSDAAKAEETAAAIAKKVDVREWSQSISGDSVTWDLSNQKQNALGDQAVEQALKIIEGRINAFGVKEPTLQRQGAKESYQILLQMPGVDDPERVKQLIGKQSKLELMKIGTETFQTFPTEDAAKQTLGGVVPPNKKILPYVERDDDKATSTENKPKQYVILDYPAIVNGSELRDAVPFTRGGSDYNIEFHLKPTGAQTFGEWTGKNIGKYLAIVLDDEVKSAPVIRGQIFDTGQIEGRFTQQSAEDLALTLKSGALPASLEYQEERTVGPSLGADSIRAGVNASLGGLALVVAFMLFYYRGSGVNAVVALILNMLLTMAALVYFGSTLTLPGIAGLILGIGMAVDSNVLIFERIREELRLGVGVVKAVDLGFDRAFITIIDTHVTTVISSVILYMYGSGPIRGFAVTLILGLLINLFSAVFVSKTIFIALFSGKEKVESLSI